MGAFIAMRSACARSPGIEDLNPALDNALDNPIGQLRLQDFIEPHHRVAVVMSDKARRLPRKEMIDALHRELPHLPHNHFTMVIANGTHPPSDPDELGIPQEVIQRYEWVSHCSTDWKSLTYVGRTRSKFKKFFYQILKQEITKSWQGRGNAIESWFKAIAAFNFHEMKDLFAVLLPVRLVIFFLSSIGMPVFLNKAAVQADWIITLGHIQPHYFCGFSGGIKGVFPGVASKLSVAFNHFMKVHPSARIGKTDGNIVREDLETVAKLVPKITIFNVVGGQDGKIVGIISGDAVVAHREGVKIARDACQGNYENRTDIVVVSAAPPLGASIYQIAKALVPAGFLVKPGGTIICTGPCREGLGGSTLILNQIIFRNGIKNYLPNGVTIRLVSEISDDVVKRSFMKPASSLSKALDEAYDLHGPSATLSIIPNASHLLVYSEKTH